MVEISPYSESKEIVGARQLLKEGRFHEALLVLEDLEEKGILADSDRLSCHLLKSHIYICFGNYEESLKNSQQAYQESKTLNNQLFSIDALVFMAWSLAWLGNLEKAFKLAIQGEDILNNLSNIPTPEREKREGYIAGVKASNCWYKGDIKQSDIYATKSLEMFEKIGDKNGLVILLLFIGSSKAMSKSDLKSAQTTLERGLTLAEEINHPYSKSNYPAMLGVIYALKGEFKKALRYNKIALPNFKENNNKHWYLATLNNMSEVYIELGDFDSALLYIKQALEFAKKTVNNWQLGSLFGTIIELLFNMGDFEQAHMYLEQLEDLNKIDATKRIERMYKYSKAILLKASPRIRNRAKAEELFYQIIKEETDISDTTIKSYLHLCDLLLDEMQSTQELEILEEINPLINQLSNIAEESNSFWTLSETYILQAKLATLKLNLTEARRLLNKAQKIAEEHEMHRLATKVSIEHDILLNKMNTWENLDESSVTLKERFELAKLSEHMAHMLKKHPIEIPKASEEDPVTILIINEDGTPLFSHSFIEDKVFESHLFSGFLTTLDYFMKKTFSEGLDRFIFGNYTLLLKSVAPFFICYIFSGDSYYALQRLQYFIEIVQKKGVWRNLINLFQAHRYINLTDIPLLESLITEIFVTKSVVFSEL